MTTLICDDCGEAVGPCDVHPDASIQGDHMSDGERLYWCDGCAETTAIGAVLHICASGDALGLGGHEPIIQHLTTDDVQRVLDELAAEKKP